jgi:hypothetical protein
LEDVEALGAVFRSGANGRTFKRAWLVRNLALVPSADDAILIYTDASYLWRIYLFIEALVNVKNIFFSREALQFGDTLLNMATSHATRRI